MRVTRSVAPRGCILTLGCAMVMAVSAVGTPPATAATCGIPYSNADAPRTTDALAALGIATGGLTCALSCPADVDTSGTVSAADGLRMLQYVAGRPVTLECAACADPLPALTDAPGRTKTSVEGGANLVFHCSTTFLVTAARDLGAIQFRVDRVPDGWQYRPSTDARRPDFARCEALTVEPLWLAQREFIAGACLGLAGAPLRAAAISLAGIAPDTSLLRCEAISPTASPNPEAFGIEVEEAVDPSLQAALASVEIVDIACEGPFPLATSTTTSTSIPTTSSTSSTTSLLTTFDAHIDYAIFPTEALGSASIHVELDDQNFGVVETLDLDDCQPLAEGASVGHDGTDFFFDFTTMQHAKLDQAQTVLRCMRSSHPPEDPIAENWFRADVRAAQTASGAAAAAVPLCAVDFGLNTPAGARYLCGDADANGKVAVGDALAALLTSVGSASCNPSRCDVDASGSVTASDALAILQRVVGLDVALLCATSCG